MLCRNNTFWIIFTVSFRHTYRMQLCLAGNQTCHPPKTDERFISINKSIEKYAVIVKYKKYFMNFRLFSLNDRRKQVAMPEPFLLQKIFEFSLLFAIRVEVQAIALSHQ